ncbi:MAG: RtcB family protein, partial [Verrucomicrobiota bacterium]
TKTLGRDYTGPELRKRMPLINGNDLIEAGWAPGPQFPQILAAAAELEAKGISDPKYLLKLLARDFEKTSALLAMREEPVEWGEAIEATCELDEKNIAAVRRFMAELLRTPIIERGAIMPDACPAGSATATIPVGGAIETEGAILPAAHSADICCSMYASVFRCEKDTAAMLDDLMASTRFGFGGRAPQDRIHHPVLEEPVWGNPFLSGLQEFAAKHIADQGDGNHFAFLGKMRVDRALIDSLGGAGYDDIARALRDATRAGLDTGGGESFYTLVTHHGSRGLGAQVYKRGHQAAIKETARIAKGIPKAAAWLDIETGSGAEYWEALEYVGRWTRANHEAIHARFIDLSEASKITEFGNEHNFVWRKGNRFLHGKGATPAWNDPAGRPLLGLIPLNMAAPILLTLGRNNQNYLGFAPHGAGRNQSRTAMMREFRKASGEVTDSTVARAIQQATKGLDIRWFYGKGDLSESPLGYKPAPQVRAQIEHFDLAEIVAEITPLGSIMAGDAGPKPWQRAREELTPKQKRQIEHRAGRRKQRQALRDWDGDETD